VPKLWKPISFDRSYLRINSKSLFSATKNTGLRDDVRLFWSEKLDCERNNKYESKFHTKGKHQALDKCLESLEENIEYNYLQKNFILEYEKCVNEFKKTTVCLDAIVVRRLLIEYQTCCNRNITIYSTICNYKDFNFKYSEYNITSLVKQSLESKSNTCKKNSYVFYFFLNCLILLFNLEIGQSNKIF
jgi:hypothetical protein